MINNIATPLAHPKQDAPTFDAARIVNEASTTLSAAFIWHESDAILKLKILSKIVF
ncbi:MAG TPA: hypothetical protein VNK25_03190 [Candidatus Nitrosotenuis sp.]|nr:hypothetical protein [Candidatus Nitrosotenuis sp.]